MVPESKIFGVGVRSFCALFIICISTLALTYLTIQSGDDNNLMLFATSALSFLFGKAAGEQESKKPTTP